VARPTALYNNRGILFERFAWQPPPPPTSLLILATPFPLATSQTLSLNFFSVISIRRNSAAEWQGIFCCTNASAAFNEKSLFDDGVPRREFICTWGTQIIVLFFIFFLIFFCFSFFCLH
jgi:hypothetical protein